MQKFKIQLPITTYVEVEIIMDGIPYEDYDGDEVKCVAIDAIKPLINERTINFTSKNKNVTILEIARANFDDDYIDELLLEEIN